MKRMNKKGFTIVELSIVIAVIAILSAVLIPTFSGIVKNAKNSANIQDAQNTYTQYIAQLDARTETPADAAVFTVASDSYILIKDGKVEVDDKGNFKSYESVDKAIEALGYTSGTYETDNTKITGLTLVFKK